MKRESVVFALGLMVVLVPFLGIPTSWKYSVFVLLGLLLMLLGYQLRHRAYLRSIERENGERQTEMYAETIVSAEEGSEPKSRRARTKHV